MHVLLSVGSNKALTFGVGASRREIEILHTFFIKNVSEY
jgi:hypothetical protein